MTVNSPQNIRPPEWKASATRIFGMLSLVLGCASAVLCLIVIQSRSYRLWNYGLPGIFSLLGLLLAANLVYVGAFTLMHGTIPITPRPLLRGSSLANVRLTLGSISIHHRLMSVVLLYVGCAAVGAYSSVSLQQWIHDSHVGQTSGFEFYRTLFGDPENSLGVQVLFWALHFPVSMSVAMFAAMALDLIRERPGSKIAASMVLLFLAAPVTALVAIVLCVPVYILAYYIVPYFVYLPMIPIGAVFLNLSRAALINDWDTGVPPTPPKHWTS